MAQSTCWDRTEQWTDIETGNVTFEESWFGM